MDALAFDQLYPEIEERRQDDLSSSNAEAESGDSRSEGSRGETIDREYYVASDLATGSTVPVTAADSPIDLNSGAERAAAYAFTKSSTSSSSSSSDHQSLSFGSASLYQPEFMAPRINYDRENKDQKLIAVIGREFDGPNLVASDLQKLVPNQLNSETPKIKFVPFTLRRKVLLKGSFDSRELKKHDLICMCYNASEARILLTGPDGFYTSLLKHVESLLGEDGHTTRTSIQVLDGVDRGVAVLHTYDKRNGCSLYRLYINSLRPIAHIYLVRCHFQQCPWEVSVSADRGRWVMI